MRGDSIGKVILLIVLGVAALLIATAAASYAFCTFFELLFCVGQTTQGIIGETSLLEMMLKFAGSAALVAIIVKICTKAYN